MIQLTGILIDPFNRTITEHTAEAETSYEFIRDALWPDGEFGYISHVALGASHGAWVDDEGLLKDWDQQAFFQFVNGQTVAGRAIVLYDDENGDTYSCKLPLKLVQGTVRWLDPQEVHVPTPRMTTVEPDGTEKTTLLADREEWDYNHQPR